jgi:hypothetical protein
MVDPECLDLSLPVLADHVHEFFGTVSFPVAIHIQSEFVPVRVPLKDLLESLLVSEQTLTSLNDQGCRV